jgi:hypothetical protein
MRTRANSTNLPKVSRRDDLAVLRGCMVDYGVAPPGKRTVNTEPLPGSLVTVTSPPIMRASLRVILLERGRYPLKV